MKTGFNTIQKTALVLLLALGSIVVQAQETGTGVKEGLETKQFVFNVQTVLPATGSARQVSGENYTIKVSGDSLISYLPYFGRAYTAPIGSEGGIKFTSTNFDYAVKAKKKNRWEVSMRPKDGSDLRQFLLTVYDNGSARLQAMSNNRQPISYNGTVVAAK